MTTWFTSDMHFGHTRIIELCGRPFEDVNHMNAELMRRWNERVMPDDTIYVLGDAVMGTREQTLPLLDLLHGKKVLVMGNHDYCWPHLWKASQSAKADRWYRAYRLHFKELWFGGEFHLGGEFNPGSIRVELNHFPYVGDSHEENRYAEHRPLDRGEPLLHGHIHDAWKLKQSPAGTPMLNVGVDVHDFAPISEEEVVKMLEVSEGSR